MTNGNGILAGLMNATSIAAGLYTTHSGLIVQSVSGITTGRARSLVAGAVSLISLAIGGVAMALSSRSVGTGRGRVAAILALLLGLTGVVLSVMHLGSSTGGFGTGGGRAGAIVALVLGLIGVNLGGVALIRSRRRSSTND